MPPHSGRRFGKRGIGLRFDAGGQRADLDVAGGDGRLELLSDGLALAQDKEQLLPKAAFEGFDDICLLAPATPIAQTSEFEWITFAFEDGWDDRLGADTINVTEHMMAFQVQFGEHPPVFFLEEPNFNAWQ